uniref:NADH dehydrogenase subunit 1 n=1 Tax=Choristocarpus tenellus TaxID=116065 RepID=UPI002E7707FB|nr:NADH dehydrogenase subunit 1 [Choristocarpus tenellus]WBP69802.1 NADH dehydrogenase subunit 1 [Choristocarpus tenellus]
MNFIFSLFTILSLIIPLLVAVAYFTLAERKIIASIQRRRGPNVIGFMGLLQPLADGLKLFVKETVLPTNANTVLFLLAPIVSFFLSLIAWAVIPFGYGQVVSDIDLGLLYSLSISSLGVYGVLISGWSSNSKYAFLGGLRSAAQIISYEVCIGFLLVNLILCAGSANLTEIVLAQKEVWFIVPLLPISILFFICCLAETNRHPFDLPEAEAELVSGYNVEYSAIGFALFFLGEYANMLVISALTSIFFFWWLVAYFFFYICTMWYLVRFKNFIFLLFFFIWVRAILPRYRYDQLIELGWKCFIPLSVGFLLLTAGILLSFNWLN